MKSFLVVSRETKAIVVSKISTMCFLEGAISSFFNKKKGEKCLSSMNSTKFAKKIKKKKKKKKKSVLYLTFVDGF
jgi:hypothetical protein